METTTTRSTLRNLVLRSTEGRTPAPLNAVGEELLIKAGGRDTDERFAFFHLTVPAMSGPPLHVHTREDELFYIVDGELTFQIDDGRIVASAGTTVFAPRGIVHTYQNFSLQTGRLLIMVTPAGLDRFFEELSAGTPRGAMPNIAFLEGLHVKYGITTMAPPLGR
jgi:quercetin dioxygenase-like cupin family protein